MQAVEGGTEKLAVIHRETRNGQAGLAVLLLAPPFLELFQVSCRADSGPLGNVPEGGRGAPSAEQNLIPINMLGAICGPGIWRPALTSASGAMIVFRAAAKCGRTIAGGCIGARKPAGPLGRRLRQKGGERGQLVSGETGAVA